MLPMTLYLRHVDHSALHTVLSGFGEVDVDDNCKEWSTAEVTWGNGLLQAQQLVVAVEAQVDAQLKQDLLDDIRSGPATPAQAEALQCLRRVEAAVVFPETTFNVVGSDPKVTLAMALAKALDGVLVAPGFVFDGRGRVLIDMDGDCHDDATWPATLQGGADDILPVGWMTLNTLAPAPEMTA